MSFRDWISCPECENDGDQTFTEWLGRQRRVIKCQECGYEEAVELDLE